MHWSASEVVMFWWRGQQGTGQQGSSATLLLKGSGGLGCGPQLAGMMATVT